MPSRSFCWVAAFAMLAAPLAAQHRGGGGGLAWRRALFSSSGVLRQPALPRHSPTRPESTVGPTLGSSAEPRDSTSILLGAPALRSPRRDRSLQPHPPEPSGEGRLH